MNTLAGAGAIIKNSDDQIYMIKIKRRDMERWELPSAVRDNRESIFLTLCRCVELDSSGKYTVRIGRPVCFALNKSEKEGYQYYGMFFECELEDNIARPSTSKVVFDKLPKEVRQNVLEDAFVDWREIEASKIHPQHRDILCKWSGNPGGPIFAVVSDADSEYKFYNENKQVISYSLTDSYQRTPISNRQFSVALSFAGEHRDKVRDIDQELTKLLSPDKVFFDERYQAEIAGINGDLTLQEIYHKDSDMVAVFLCREYKEKEWCLNVECRAIRDRMKNNQEKYVLPLRFDDTEVPGFFSIDIILDISKQSPKDVAKLIYDKFVLAKGENYVMPPSNHLYP